MGILHLRSLSTIKRKYNNTKPTHDTDNNRINWREVSPGAYVGYVSKTQQEMEEVIEHIERTNFLDQVDTSSEMLDLREALSNYGVRNSVMTQDGAPVVIHQKEERFDSVD